MTSMRHVATALVAAAVVAVCVVAGTWQYGRHADRADAKALFERNAATDPVPWEDVTPSASAEWSRVELAGEFLPDSRVALRDRRVEGQRTDQALAWFRTSSGDAVLVLAGWQPAGADPEPLPGGPGLVTAMLRVMEADDGRGADTASRITPAQAPPPPGAVTAVYAAALPECAPSACLDLPGEPVPQPQPTLGPHLAYAFQWWLFAVLAPVGAILLVRRERAEAVPQPARRARRGRAAGPTDEEIEDAL